MLAVRLLREDRRKKIEVPKEGFDKKERFDGSESFKQIQMFVSKSSEASSLASLKGSEG